MLMISAYSPGASRLHSWPFADPLRLLRHLLLKHDAVRSDVQAYPHPPCCQHGTNGSGHSAPAATPPFQAAPLPRQDAPLTQSNPTHRPEETGLGTSSSLSSQILGAHHMGEDDLLEELRRALTIALTAIEKRLDRPIAAPGASGATPCEAGADVQRWEYTTWKVRSIWGSHSQILMVDGQEIDSEERPSFYEALARAGEDGWELMAFNSADGAMIFKRPKSTAAEPIRHNAHDTSSRGAESSKDGSGRGPESGFAGSSAGYRNCSTATAIVNEP
jgi:hypothetical protein